jgi:hypothetical protein
MALEFPSAGDKTKGRNNEQIAARWLVARRQLFRHYFSPRDDLSSAGTLIPPLPPPPLFLTPHRCSIKFLFGDAKIMALV